MRRLLSRIISLAGHTIGRLTDFITVATKNITGFWAEFGYDKIPYRTFLVRFGSISGLFGLAIGILARQIRTMTSTRPNSSDMPPKRTNKVRLGIIIKLN